MKKILYYTTDTSPQSGAMRCLLETIRGLPEDQFDFVSVFHKEFEQVGLMTAAEQERTYFLTLPQARPGRSIWFYLWYMVLNLISLVRLAVIIHRERVALVHVNEILDFQALIAAALMRVPCILHVRTHLLEPEWLYGTLCRVTTWLAAAVVVVSESVRYHMYQSRGLNSDKIITIYDLASPVDQFHPGVEGVSIRNELGIDQESFLVGLVGKLVRVKGHAALLRAAPLVLEKFPQTCFLFCGGKMEGPDHEKYAFELEALTIQLGLQDRVFWTGFRADVPQIMAACDVVTMCSDHPDPFPGVVLQAMAVGRPVVAANLGGATEQIEDGVSGVLVNAQNPAKLAEAINDLLGNPEKRQAMGKVAHERVNSLFANDIYFDKLISLYENLIDRNIREW